MGNEIRVEINSTGDIVTARQEGRRIAAEIGFSGTDLTVIAAAISEMARNILDHAKQGEVLISDIEDHGKSGILIVARDQGPGIRNIEQAMEYGYSTHSGLGAGLPGAKWLMDDFDIESAENQGTTVTMKKYLNRNVRTRS